MVAFIAIDSPRGISVWVCVAPAARKVVHSLLAPARKIG